MGHRPDPEFVYLPNDLPFKVVCELLEACVGNRRKAVKHIEHFIQTKLPPNNPEVFEVYRLIIPKVGFPLDPSEHVGNRGWKDWLTRRLYWLQTNVATLLLVPFSVLHQCTRMSASRYGMTEPQAGHGGFLMTEGTLGMTNAV